MDQRGQASHDDPDIVDEVAAKALFDSLRAAMRGTDPAGQVPAIVGGYLVAGAGEAAEGDRRRPIGQLRRLLSDAAFSAEMTDGQRWVLTSFYGLDAYPADIDAGGQSASLAGRVPLDVLQHQGDRRARRGSIEGYRRRGVAAVACQLVARRSDGAVPRAAVVAPHAASWFIRPVTEPFRRILAAQREPVRARRRLLRVAVADARDYLASSGPREPRLQEALGYYGAVGCGLEAVLGGARRPSRTDAAAAQAAVSAALWDLVCDEARCWSVLAAGVNIGDGGRQEPMPGAYLGRGWLVTAPAEAAPLAAGEVTVASLDGAARAALAAFRGGVDVDALCELCLWALRKLGGEVPASLAARVLMLAGRSLRQHKSWRTVTLAEEIFVRAGPCELWFNAAQDAVSAAGEHREFAFAEQLLDRQQRAYREQFRPGPHLVPEIDVVEFSQQLALIRAGVKRRQAESAVYGRRQDHAVAAKAVNDGWPLAVESWNRLDELPDGWDGFGAGEQRHRGDATGAWKINPLVRQGELVVLRGVLARRRALEGRPTVLFDWAHSLAMAAGGVAAGVPKPVGADGLTQVAKLVLAVAVAADDADEAAAAATKLLVFGVPPSRWGAAAAASISGTLRGRAADVIADLASEEQRAAV